MSIDCLQFKDLRKETKLSQNEFAKKYRIPKGTYKHWEAGERIPPDYVFNMLKDAVKRDIKEDGSNNPTVYTLLKSTVPHSKKHNVTGVWHIEGDVVKISFSYKRKPYMVSLPDIADIPRRLPIYFDYAVDMIDMTIDDVLEDELIRKYEERRKR